MNGFVQNFKFADSYVKLHYFHSSVYCKITRLREVRWSG